MAVSAVRSTLLVVPLNPDNPHILIVDDEQEIRELLSRFLQNHGCRTSQAEDGKAMAKVLANHTIDLIVLDLMMPGEDGLVLCRKLRSHSNLPVIMLTAMGEETDRIIGLEMGADDYLAKPFSPRELLARIKSVLRRTHSLPDNHRSPATPEQSLVRFDRWQLDRHKRELLDEEGITLSLSTAEFDLLQAFLEHPQRVLTRDQLLDLARGRNAQLFDRSIDTLVSRLRRKLEKDPKKPELIKTIWGGGYSFSAEVEYVQ